MILQDPMASLNPVYTVGEQVAEPLRQHQHLAGKTLWDKVTEVLRQLGIPSPRERLQNYPHQMSGGMRQRVVGGIAISCRPKLIIADEPTTALDATIQAQYLALLKDLQRQTNVAMIFVSHDFGIVARMCDRVAVMYAGKLSRPPASASCSGTRSTPTPSAWSIRCPASTAKSSAWPRSRVSPRPC